MQQIAISKLKQGEETVGMRVSFLKDGITSCMFDVSRNILSDFIDFLMLYQTCVEERQPMWCMVNQNGSFSVNMSDKTRCIKSNSELYKLIYSNWYSDIERSMLDSIHSALKLNNIKYNVVSRVATVPTYKSKAKLVKCLLNSIKQDTSRPINTVVSGGCSPCEIPNNLGIAEIEELLKEYQITDIATPYYCVGKYSVMLKIIFDNERCTIHMGVYNIPF